MKTIKSLSPAIALGFALAISGLCSSVYAGGTMHLEGEIRSFDEKQVSVLSAKKIWRLERASLPAATLTLLKTARAGQPFDAWIDFASVVAVDDQTTR